MTNAGRFFLLAALAACGDDGRAAIDAGVPDAAADAAAAGPYNILVVVVDDQRADDPVHMPFLSGRQDWIRFAHSSVNVAWCCPSRSTTLTGSYSHHHGVETLAGKDFDPSSTIATWLQAAGYRTMLAGKYLNGYPFRDREDVPPGWTDWHAFVKGSYFDYKLSHDGDRQSYGRADTDYSTDVLGRVVVDFIEETTDRPWLAVYTPKAPHTPLVPAPRHDGAFADLPIELGPSFNEEDIGDKPSWVQGLPLRDPEVMIDHRRRRLEMTLAVDEALADMFAALEATDQLERTVVIYTSDNGYALGEHRWKTKRCEYDECTQVPLYIRMPGQSGRTVLEAVSNVDLAATIAELAGVVPGHAQDGLSLVPLLRERTPEWTREGVLIHFIGDGRTPPGETDDPDADERVAPSFWGLRSARHKYVEIEQDNGGPMEFELYDLADDPHELDNLAGDPAWAEIQAELADLLAAEKSR